MVRRRRSMSQHVDIFKRAPIEESIDPSSAVSSKTEGMELRGTVRRNKDLISRLLYSEPTTTLLLLFSFTKTNTNNIVDPIVQSEPIFKLAVICQ